jgi:hypothetical protein
MGVRLLRVAGRGYLGGSLGGGGGRKPHPRERVMDDVILIVVMTLGLRSIEGLIITNLTMRLMTDTHRILTKINNSELEDKAINLIDEDLAVSFPKELVNLHELFSYLKWRKLHKEVLAYERSSRAL